MAAAGNSWFVRTVPFDETTRYFAAEPREEGERRLPRGVPLIYFHELTIDAEVESEISMELAAVKITALDWV